MTFSIRAITRALVAPEHRISCSTEIWESGLKELKHRSAGYRESGAFLVGIQNENRRQITRFVYYDELDPQCLKTGIVVFDGSGYGPLWKLCREMKLTVVADIHTHPGPAYQSSLDRNHPMVATTGHIALIVPHFAARVVKPHELGIYEYSGNHCWRNHSGPGANKFFYIGI